MVSNPRRAGPEGSEAPLQHPDAPQRRAGGNADSAGGGAGGVGGGAKSSSSPPLGGTSSVAALNQRSARISGIHETFENEQRGRIQMGTIRGIYARPAPCAKPF